MRKIIISMENCQRCETLKAQCPDAEVVELDQATLLALARATNVKMMPMVLLSDEVNELAEVLNCGSV